MDDACCNACDELKWSRRDKWEDGAGILAMRETGTGCAAPVCEFTSTGGCLSFQLGQRTGGSSRAVATATMRDMAGDAGGWMAGEDHGGEGRHRQKGAELQLGGARCRLEHCRVVPAHGARERGEEEERQRIRGDSNRRCQSLSSQHFSLAVVDLRLRPLYEHSWFRSAVAGRFRVTRLRARWEE